MKRFVFALLSLPAFLVGCGDSPGEGPSRDGPNPFTEDLSGGKADSGYLTRRGLEVHLTLEADAEAEPYRILDAPAELAQFAFTAMKRPRDDYTVAGYGFYAMVLAEGLVDEDKTEWLVDGAWIPAAAAREADRSVLRRFRIKDVSAVVFDDTVDEVEVGQTMDVVVPIRPFSIYREAGDRCAYEYPGIGLSQDIYWFLWLPSWTCRQQSGLVQTMRVEVTEIIDRPAARYPEYDRLRDDGRLDAVVLFGELDHKDAIEEDGNWERADVFCGDLLDAGFVECGAACCNGQPLCEEHCDTGWLGRRFLTSAAEHVVRVDVFYPDLFKSVADRRNFGNWQRAVSEHEVVIYLGHAVLGSGFAFQEASYPEFYQIFMVFACLSYGYYVHPIYTGKGGWDQVDVISLADMGKPREMLPMTSHLIRGLMEGFESGGSLSWQDLMGRIGLAGRHSRAGVSGVSDNRFTPGADPDDPEPDPDPEQKRFENRDPLDIPDDDPAGVTSTIEVPHGLDTGAVRLELDITHTYVGDLHIALSRGGDQVVVWDREGGATDDIRRGFPLDDWTGQDAAGTWTLHVSDNAGLDTGRLNRWAILIETP